MTDMPQPRDIVEKIVDGYIVQGLVWENEGKLTFEYKIFTKEGNPWSVSFSDAKSLASIARWCDKWEKIWLGKK